MKAQLFRTVCIIAILLASASGIQAQSSFGIWISPAELARRPTSGAAWDRLLAKANSTCTTPNLADQDDAANVCVLAKALVFARTGEQVYRSDVVSALLSIVNSGTYEGRALALGRELAAYVIAADLIDLKTLDPALHASFSDKIRQLRTTPAGGGGVTNLIECHELRPNNWGTHCGASRAAVAVYLGDTAELARTAQVFKGWLGDRSSYAGFRYRDLFWQCDESAPVGVNPPGCTKEGHSIDGVLPDDQERGGDFTWPPPKENYVWEGLQGAVVQAAILQRAGYDVFNWENQALLRAVQWLHSQADYPAATDNKWIPHLINYYYGTEFPAPVPASPGKNMGWTDWAFDTAGPAPPTFNPAGGSYDSTQSVAISHPMTDATIHYTVDGSTPTASSTVYAAPIPLLEPATIQAIAVIPDWASSDVASATYNFQALMPGFSPPPSLYPTSQSVALSARTAGAAIYYTVDGSTPTTSSALYTDPIAVTQTTTIKAIAVLSGLADSDVAMATYSVQVTPPTFSPAGGRFTVPQAVMLNTTDGATIYYTTDGSVPTTASALYLGEHISVSQPSTIRAISVADGFANSPVATASYTFQAATPTFSLDGKTYDGPQSVALSVSTPDATIYYTTDGSAPTTSSTQYIEPIAVSQNTTLKAIAAVSGWSNSSTETETYTLKPATPIFSLAEGTYSGPQSITITNASPNATIYYTTDGSTPSTSSEIYSGPITVTITTMIKAMAASPGWTESAVASRTFTIQ